MWEGYITAHETRVRHIRHPRLEAGPPHPPEGDSPGPAGAVTWHRGVPLNKIKK